MPLLILAKPQGIRTPAWATMTSAQRISVAALLSGAPPIDPDLQTEPTNDTARLGGPERLTLDRTAQREQQPTLEASRTAGGHENE
jgi:hypothetical protein